MTFIFRPKLRAGIAACAFLLSTSLACAGPVTLRVSADTYSAGTAWRDIMVPWMKRVEAASGGELVLQGFPDGRLSKLGHTVAAVESGVADIGSDLPSLYGQGMASLNVLGLPGLIDDPADAAEALYAAYEEGSIGTDLPKAFHLLWVQVSANMRIFSENALDPTDFDGMKIGVGNKARALLISDKGGVPIMVAPPGYYNGLQRGVFDGLMTSTGAFFDTKTNELVDHALVGPFGGGSFIVGINESVYKSLPEDLRAALDAESGIKQSRIASRTQFDREQQLMATLGTENIHVLTEDELAEWRPSFAQVRKVWSEETPKGADILASFEKALSQVE